MAGSRALATWARFGPLIAASALHHVQRKGPLDPDQQAVGRVIGHPPARGACLATPY